MGRMGIGFECSQNPGAAHGLDPWATPSKRRSVRGSRSGPRIKSAGSAGGWEGSAGGREGHAGGWERVRGGRYWG